MSMTMFVDPGLGGTGIAVFHEITKGSIKPPIHYDRITTNSDDGDFLQRSFDIAYWVGTIAYEYEICNNLVIEFPELWGSSVTSNAAARGGKNGIAPLMKLASLSGMISFEFQRVARAMYPSVRYISPSSWKGQLKKDQVINRIRCAYNGWTDEEKFPIRDHEADAIGMGLAFQKGGKV